MHTGPNPGAGSLYIFRHLVAIAILPFTVTILIPVWLAGSNAIPLALGSSWAEIGGQIGGLLLLGIGGLLFVASLQRFAGEGRGTLAPWDPPRRLVVRGPYRYVRNPMISGVVLVLFGEALVLLSRPHLLWALLFLAINLLYIPLIEEPMLAGRFGSDYQEYRRHVRRLVPRLQPWTPEDSRHQF